MSHPTDEERPEPELVCDSLDRTAWLAARRTGIGSSDAPAILGVSPFATPLSVAAAKQGLHEDDHESELMRWGRYVEGPMIQAFLDEQTAAGAKGWQARPSGKMYRSRRPGHGFMLATLDGDVLDPAGKAGTIECKLKIFGADEWEREGVPDHVQVQAQHGLEVVQRTFVIVIGLLDGYRLRWKRLPIDRAALEEKILPEERRFWEALERGEAIPATTGPPGINARVLKALHPQDSGETIPLPEHAEEHYRAWRQAAAAEKEAKRRKDEARNAIAQLLGRATFGVLPSGTTLSLTTTTRAPFETPAATFRVLREVAGRRGPRRATRESR